MNVAICSNVDLVDVELEFAYMTGILQGTFSPLIIPPIWFPEYSLSLPIIH